ANVERLADRHARKGIDRRADHACAVRALDVAALVDRVAAAVDDAAEQFMTHRHFRVTRLRYHARAGIESLDTTDRHQVQLFVREADDLGFDLRVGRGNDVAAAADRGLAAGGYECQTGHLHQLAFDGQGGQAYLIAVLAERV